MLLEEEVRSEFLVLVAGKIGLDDHIPLEAEKTQLKSQHQTSNLKATICRQEV